MLSDTMYNVDDFSGPYTSPSTLSELTGAPHIPLGTVLLRNLPALSAFGLKDPIGQILGKGAFGSAYELPLGGRTVLKITRDPTEVQAANRLIGKSPKRIVHVYGVWGIPRTHHRGLRGWYAIHRQYLKPLGNRDRYLVDTIFNVYDDDTLDLTLCRKGNHAMIDKWRGYLREELFGADGVPLDEDGARVSVLGGGRLLARTLNILGRIGDAVAEMHKAGIDWEDIHSGNLMVGEDGHLVIADIGFGEMHHYKKHSVPILRTHRAEAHVAAFRQASTGASPL